MEIRGMMLGMKIVAKNRRVRHDYDITDTIEAGVILTGQEVKSCRMGHINLAGSYVSFLPSPLGRGIKGEGKPLLKNATISPYIHASHLENYNPGRDRILLLKKSEEDKLRRIADEKGISILPLEVRAGKFIKVLLGIGRGRKKYDKRQKIKEKDLQRKLKRGEDM
jgi:SsrA-binding protein